MTTDSRPPKGRVWLPLALVPLTVVALVLSGWFLLHTRYAAASIQRTIDQESRPGVLEYDSIALGPGLLQATLLGVRLRDRSGALVAEAGRVDVELAALPLFAKKKTAHLQLKHLVVDDLTLRLEWNDRGDLGLVDPFKTRAFGLADAPEPVVDTLIDLAGIEINRGKLVLAWPKFGFVFDDINGRGDVRIDADGLHIDVPRLASGEGAIWGVGAHDKLKAFFATLTGGPTAATAPTPGLPFTGVTIEPFTWKNKGFDTRVVIDGAGWGVTAAGAMSFSPAGIDHALSVDVRPPKGFMDAATQGAITGLEHVALTTKGLGAVAHVALGPFALASYRLGAIAADGVRSEGADIDLLGERATFKGHLEATRLDVLRGRFDGFSGEIASSVGWKGFEGKRLLNLVMNPPKGVLAWASALPLDTALHITSKGARADRWRQLQDTAGRAIEALAIEALDVTGGISSLTVSVGKFAATGYGSVSVKAEVQPSIGFSGVSLDATIDAVATDVPKSAVVAMLPKTTLDEAIPERITGPARVTGNLLDLGSLKLVYPAR